MKISISAHHFQLSLSFWLNHSSGCEVVSTELLMYIYLMVIIDKRLFMSWWPICLSLRNVYSDSLPTFAIELSLYYWVVRFFIYSKYKSLIRYMIANISSHSVVNLFTFLTVFLETQKFLNLMKFNLSVLWMFVLLVSCIRRFA